MTPLLLPLVPDEKQSKATRSFACSYDKSSKTASRCPIKAFSKG